MDNSDKVYVPVGGLLFRRGRDAAPFYYLGGWADFHHRQSFGCAPLPRQKGGRQGDKYTVKINGKVSAIYFERSAALNGPVLGRWFVERNALAEAAGFLLRHYIFK